MQSNASPMLSAQVCTDNDAGAPADLIQQVADTTRQHIDSGILQLQAGNPLMAMQWFREGLATLGDAYRSALNIDQTPYQLQMVHDDEQMMRLFPAAHRLKQVAETRLKQFEIKCSVHGNSSTMR